MRACGLIYGYLIDNSTAAAVIRRPLQIPRVAKRGRPEAFEQETDERGITLADVVTVEGVFGPCLGFYGEQLIMRPLAELERGAELRRT